MLVGHAMLQVGALAMLVCAGLVTFAALALCLGIADWRDLLRRRRRQPA
jgi:aryl carrier-like protein